MSVSSSHFDSPENPPRASSLVWPDPARPADSPTNPHYKTENPRFMPMSRELDIWGESFFWELDAIYWFIASCESSKERRQLIKNHLTLCYREEFYFYVLQACIADGHGQGKDDDPEFAMHAWENPLIPIATKQKAIVEFAFWKKFTTDHYRDFEMQVFQGASQMVPLPPATTLDRLKTVLRK